MMARKYSLFHNSERLILGLFRAVSASTFGNGRDGNGGDEGFSAVEHLAVVKYIIKATVPSLADVVSVTDLIPIVFLPELAS